MTTVPPPPPPPPAPAASATPWHKQPAILGLLVVAAVAVPTYFLFFSGDDEPNAGSTSSSLATTTSSGSSTTAATTTTAATSTTAGSTTTTGATTTTAATTTSSGPQFDPTGTPTYGSFTLAAGFLPDPHQQSVTSGGVVNATYLGGGCFGYGAVAPDMELEWTGTGTLLRFYFIADDLTSDTVLIINDSAGTWWCVDDSFGTGHPTIDFATGPNGTYDIWVASYDSAQLIPGTLYITELSANHP